MLNPSDFICNYEIINGHYLQIFESQTSVIEIPQDESLYAYRSRFSPEKFDYNITYTYKDSYESYPNKKDAPLDPKDHFKFLSHLLEKKTLKNQDLSRSIFLPGVRYYSDSIIVFERPPMQVPFSFSLDYRDNVNEETPDLSYYIPIPWQVYVCQYNPENYRLIDVAMYFSKSSLYSLDQEVYVPPLFNFYSNGNLCRPFFASSEDVEKYPQNVFGVTAAAYDWVWNSNFNFDITDNIVEFLIRQRYQQFEKYITTDQDRKYYDFLVRRPLNGFTRIVDKSYYQALFSLWSIVPVEEISFINFAPYSKNDFFYQDLLNSTSTHNFDLAVDYCSENGYILHEHESGEDTCHCEECCPEECISYDELVRDSDFNSYCEYYNPKKEQQNQLSTIGNAIDVRQKLLSAAKVGTLPPTGNQLMFKFNQAYSSTFF